MGASIIPHTKVTNRSVGSALPLDVSIVDGAGNQVTTFGGSGGTASNFAAAFPASGTAIGFKDSAGVNMAAGNLDASGNLKVSGTLTTTPPAAGTSALTNVTENAASVTVLAANANRLAFILFNDSDSAVDVKFGATASATSYNERMLPRGRYTTNDVGVNYTGRIDAIWDTTPGTAGHNAMRITELTT